MTAEVSTQQSYEGVVQFVAARTGLTFAPNRWQSAVAGIRRAMGRAGLADLARYRWLLEADRDALDDLIVELTVGETYFFRDPAQFAFIRGEVLPEIRRRRGNDHVIRAWSAGCASGEEAYSLAILFAEEGLGEQAQLRATDISRAALAKARAAAYGRWSLRNEGATAAGSYLRRVSERYVVHESIRRRVAFEHLNLALDVYPSFATGIWGMDLILCRNVLIYLDRETIRRVARRLFASLADGGWLITGPSDPSLAGDAPYETVVSDAGVFYRRAAAVAEEPSWSAIPLAPSAPEQLSFAAVAPEAGAQGASGPLEEARAALAQGDYARVVLLTHDLRADLAASVLCVRALANLDTAKAEEACAAAAARHALSPEVHYLWAVLLLELGRDEEATRAVRCALYLDRSLAAAHSTLGTILRRRGDCEGARRAYRNAHDLCAARPADEVVPLADGERAGRLAEAAEVQMALLDATRRVP